MLCCIQTEKKFEYHNCLKDTQCEKNTRTYSPRYHCFYPTQNYGCTTTKTQYSFSFELPP